MGAIGDWFVSIWYAIRNVFKLLFWCIEGIYDLGEMLNTGITVVIDLVDFFPQVVVASLVASCGVLLTLRILGRS